MSGPRKMPPSSRAALVRYLAHLAAREEMQVDELHSLEVVPETDLVERATVADRPKAEASA